MGSFDGKVVIVTGASSGVGEATARRFAALGAKVVAAARSAAKLEQLAKEIDGLAVPTDVTSLVDLKRLVQAAVDAHGRIDVLVNNAGANRRGELGEIEPDAISTIVDTNLKAPMLLTRLALPHLKATKGVVVNVASIAGHVPLPGESPYCGTKWGLRGFTFAVAEECRKDGVAITAVSPGPIETPFVLDDLESTPDLVFSQPFLTAEETAEAVVACATDRRRERALPASTLWLAKLVGVVPWLQERLRPMLEAKGRRAKAEMRARTRA